MLSAVARCYGRLNRDSAFGDADGAAAMRVGEVEVAFRCSCRSAHEKAILIAVALFNDGGKAAPGRQRSVCRRIGPTCVMESIMRAAVLESNADAGTSRR